MAFDLPTRGAHSLRRTKIYGDFLRTAALSPELNVDGSTTPVVFQTQPQNDRLILLCHAHVNLLDTGIGWHDSFGALPVLTNGVIAEIFNRQSGNAVLDLTIGIPWRRTADIFDGIGLSILSSDLAAGPDAARLEGHVSFDDIFGGPLLLPPTEGVRVVVRDNLSGLLAFRIFLSGGHA